MALRVTLTYLGEPDPESTTVTLPIPNVGTLGRGVPQEITHKILAHFDDVSPEALAHRLADLYNRNQRLPRLRVGTQDAEGEQAEPVPETPADAATPATPEAEPTTEPAPVQGDGSIPESPQE